MNSLRWRITAALVLLTVVVSLVMDVAIYRTALDQRSNSLRRDVQQRAAAAAVIYASTGTLSAGTTLNDTSSPSALQQAVERGQGGTALDAGTDRMWAAAVVGGGPDEVAAVYVNESALTDRQALDSLRTSLILITALVVVGAAALAHVVSLGLVRRLDHAARVASRMQHGDLDARIDPHGRDEIAVLSRVVDGMAAAVQLRIARERRFTADVAHELRTPVTGLVAAADLLDDADPATVLVRDGSSRLRGLVEDLLEISRLESGRETADKRAVEVAELVDDLVHQLDADIAVSGRARVSTDPRRAQRILGNLLRNALRHGAAPVTVEITAAAVTVTDHGDGFATDLLATAAEPFVTSGRGTGLGLAIAVSQAQVLGATLTYGNHADGAWARVQWAPQDTVPDPTGPGDDTGAADPR